MLLYDSIILYVYIESLWSDVSSEICKVNTESNAKKQSITSNIGSNTDVLEADHEYHEISDEENQESPLRFDKTLNFDFGPSLLAEMDQMFRSLGKRNWEMLNTPFFYIRCTDNVSFMQLYFFLQVLLLLLHRLAFLYPLNMNQVM